MTPGGSAALHIRVFAWGTGLRWMRGADCRNGYLLMTTEEGVICVRIKSLAEHL